MTQKLRPKFAEAGRIINIWSVDARVNFGGVPAYSATKGGLVWRAGNWLRSDEAEATARTIQPISRVGRVEDIADAIAAVAGEDGRWITGRVIELSGETKL